MAEKLWDDTTKRFVLFLDIMGFKERVNRTSVRDLKKSLLSFKTKNVKLKPLLESNLKGENRILMKMAQFSDSIVVITRGGTQDDLNRICKAGAILMQTALESGFALRGAMAFGNMVFDEENQIFFGSALVDAYLLEESLAFYGVVFHESTESAVKKALAGDEHYYPVEDIEVQLKGGRSKHYHLAWYKIDYILKQGSIKDDALRWLEDIRNSVSGIPRIYLDNTRKLIESDN